MNKSDSERISSVLNKIGYLPTIKERDADLIVVNSCAVRQSAMDRIYGKVEHWQKARKENKLKTILTGCVLEIDKHKLKDQFDLVLDIRDLGDLPKHLGHDLEMKTEDYFDIIPQYNSKFQAFVPIMTGCDKFCTYCAVPYTRGQEISRPVNEILAEVRKLAANGCIEITLLGQNVNSYQGFLDKKELDVAKDKRDVSQKILAGLLSKKKVLKGINGGLPVLTPAATVPEKEMDAARITFPQLLEMVCNLPGKFWVRFLTSHPYDMSDELIEIIASNKKAAKYIHLPVQCGDDQVLKRMNRHYTIDHYKKLLRKIRERIPGAAISTDIIVGFCGETEEQFNRTAELMAEVKYDMAYLAQYSPREGTVAAKAMDDSVPKSEKVRRERVLNEILKGTALAHNQKYIGRTVEVLVEKVSEVENGLFANIGKIETYKTTKFLSARQWLGQFVPVKIQKAGPWGLAGELV